MHRRNVLKSIVSAAAGVGLVARSGSAQAEDARTRAPTAGAERAASVQNAVPRTSGVLTIGGTPYPYLIEGTGLTCIVVGLAPAYPPLFPDRLKLRIRFVYVDFKNSWNAESPRGVEK